MDLIAEGFEVAFRIGNPRIESSNVLVSRNLRPYRLIACASPGYLDGRPALHHPADLSRHECMGYIGWDRLMHTEWSFTRDGKHCLAQIDGRFKINDLRAQVQAALNGFGIILGAEEMVSEHILQGRLVQVLPDYEASAPTLSLIYPVDRTQTAKLKTFVSHVMGALG